ncbi:MAG: methyltransferase [Planctomycetota bacterium]|nr:MAG: methyltransferase [Planctomycetota bacterium]
MATQQEVLTAGSESELEVEEAVRRRYTAGARAPQAELCCPAADYEPELLAAIPEEVIARDYGCGDPTRGLRRGETVLDLGSGSGKACFIAAQRVGPTGRVIGIDMNDEMLALARRAASEVARRLGYANVSFRKGRIQDLALDLEQLEAWLAEHPVRSGAELSRLEAKIEQLRRTTPLVASESVDVVISNCVLNLVRPEDKQRLFCEIHRVLRPGGRAVISDIVSDEDVPAELQRDPELWSGCIAGAWREDRFLEAFERAGLYGITIQKFAAAPWRTAAGIEFRPLTAVAYKGKEGPCLDRRQAVIYRGPFRTVTDDDGHTYRRGVRTAVCDKTYRLLGREPYAAHFEPVPPHQEVPLEQAPPFACEQNARRDPRETKQGAAAPATPAAAAEPLPACAGPGCC